MNTASPSNLHQIVLSFILIIEKREKKNNKILLINIGIGSVRIEVVVLIGEMPTW